MSDEQFRFACTEARRDDNISFLRAELRDHLASNILSMGSKFYRLDVKATPYTSDN